MAKQEVVHFLTTEENFRYANDNETDTLMWIQYPPNVPSKVRPIVIFPTMGYKETTVKVTQFDENYNGTTFEAVLSPDKSHVINLNTGME